MYTFYIVYLKVISKKINWLRQNQTIILKLKLYIFFFIINYKYYQFTRNSRFQYCKEHFLYI